MFELRDEIQSHCGSIDPALRSILRSDVQVYLGDFEIMFLRDILYLWDVLVPYPEGGGDSSCGDGLECSASDSGVNPHPQLASRSEFPELL